MFAVTHISIKIQEHLQMLFYTRLNVRVEGQKNIGQNCDVTSTRVLNLYLFISLTVLG